MPPVLHYDWTSIDFQNIIADKEAIRAVNPQRFEMEQIDAVVYLDLVKDIIVGYKDIRLDEFWVRGHMPHYPLMPGVLICEASAQLCSFFTMKKSIPFGDFIGFGGMENVRFRAPVHPGSRLVLVGKLLKSHRRQMIFNVQGFVNQTMVFHGDIIGVPMSRTPAEA